MSYQHTFTPVAFNEYKEAVSWYTQHSASVANKFVKEVKIRIQAICTDPYRYRNQYKNFYETSVRKFPFYIIYLVDDENELVVIASVYHHKRNPKKKYRKRS